MSVNVTKWIHSTEILQIYRPKRDDRVQEKQSIIKADCFLSLGGQEPTVEIYVSIIFILDLRLFDIKYLS